MNIIEVAVRRPVTVWMFTLAVLLFGMVSLSRLSLNLLPELSYPTLTVRTDYIGAAPGEVEQLVTRPIEEAVGVVKGVREVVSSSKAEQSDVVLEFEWGTKMDEASLEVREKLDVLFLPLDVRRPLILKFNPSLDPIIRYGLSNKQSPSSLDTNNTLSAHDIDQMKRLRTFAEEEIKRKIESVEGVASVRVGGGLENEIQVLVDQQRLSQLSISLGEVTERLKDENVNASGGRVQDGSQEYLVRTINQFESLDDMRNLYIATRQNKHIKLGDISEVIDTYKERSSITRFNGFEGVEIAIYKEGDANTVKVALAVAERLATLSETMDADYRLQTVYDQSLFIASAIDEVKTAAIIGGVLAMFILYFFLKNIWPTLIVSISIPVSIIATFNLMYSYDITLNIMSLGGIALAIGLLVDNSIVVLENIDSHKKHTTNALDAAVSGTSEVAMAIVASTLTTMAVFFPLVFVEGIAGQLFSDQALTVTFALGVSLVVALTLIPMLAARDTSRQADMGRVQENRSSPVDTLELEPSIVAFKPTGGFSLGVYYAKLPFVWLIRLTFYMLPFVLVSLFTLVFMACAKVLKVLFAPVLWLFDTLYNSLLRVYERALQSAMQARILVMSLIMAASLASLILLPKLGLELIPPLSQGEFFVEISLVPGAQLDSTDAVVANLARFTETLDGVERTYSLAGTGSLMNASMAQGGDHWGKLNVVMQHSASIEQSDEVKAAMREYLSMQAGVQSKFAKPELFSFATPLEIQLAGYNLDELGRYGNETAKLLSENSRFADVTSSLQIGNPELKIIFDHAKLAQLGLNAPDVSTLISSKVGGQLASKFSIDDTRVDILVRNKTPQRDSIADIGQLIINPGNTPAITLATVADIRLATGPSEITRVGQQRVVIVSANLRFGDLGVAAADAQQILEKINFPPNIQASVAGQSEEMNNSFSSLLWALALAIFLVYLVMASQFESLLHPLLILFTVPMACAGSIYGLFLTATNISVVVFIGLIMLAGIVVNNAIVLIDRINQLRISGLDKEDAIAQAAASRLRPILMTTLTTVLGLLPMAIGLGDGSEIRTPMAITVIFGLLFATLLTLFLIPILYSLFDVKRFTHNPRSSDISEQAKQETQHG